VGQERPPDARGEGGRTPVRGTVGTLGRREAVIAGLSGSALVTILTAVIHTAADRVPFLPTALAQALVRAAPGGFATWFIDRLGHWALRFAVAGTFVAFLVAGGVFGLLLPWIRRAISSSALSAGVLSFVPFWAVSVAVYPSRLSMGREAVAAITLPAYLAGGALAGWVDDRLKSHAPRATALERRYFLRAAWWGSLGLLLGGANLGRLLVRRPDPGHQLLHLTAVSPAPRPSPQPGDAAFAAVSGLTAEVTSNDAFYVVDEEIIDPDIDAATWRLAISGQIDHPMTLSYEQLLAIPAVERYQTLECISNPVGGDLMSTAKWTGVPLIAVLERAGVRSGAVEVVFRAAGGYSDSLSIAHAMDETTLIAIGMNDRVLPRAHGFPARVLSVGTYGMKNPKWLTSIEVVGRPYAGYWEQRGWSKQAAVKTEARIDVPPSGAAISGGVQIAGVAFAGDRGISRVEVSSDGGRTWQGAQLKTALSPYTWRLWRYPWNADAARRFDVLVRATDGQGRVQSSVPAAPHPNGASGYDAVTLVRGS
jgi:DMSO/TMAO reductase YedYZ molybdopterin-dependent catalytic subunit